uniref:Uncharacterized protein n=1 Tax=Balaenoptera musculus TaxID=9771 RepID=A0A8C0I6X4_BALMU
WEFPGFPGPGIRNPCYYCQYIEEQINSWTDLRANSLPLPTSHVGKWYVMLYKFNKLS